MWRWWCHCLCSCRRRSLSSWRQTWIWAVTFLSRLRCEFPLPLLAEYLLTPWTGFRSAVEGSDWWTNIYSWGHPDSRWLPPLTVTLTVFLPGSEDSSRIFVAVGFGFFLEMTHDEALRFIDKKTNQLTAYVTMATASCTNHMTGSVGPNLLRFSFKQNAKKFYWTCLCYFGQMSQISLNSLNNFR